MANKRGRPARMTVEATVPKMYESNRIDSEVDVRLHDEPEDTAFDFENFDYMNISPRELILIAPIARIDEKHGQMTQRWVGFKQENGARVKGLERRGYRLRKASTVPNSFNKTNEKLQLDDNITISNELVLMEVPLFHYNRLQQAKHNSNNQELDSISDTEYSKLTIRNQSGDKPYSEGVSFSDD